MEKAIITSQQAKAIEEFRDNKWSDADILYGWFSDGDDFPTKLHESIRSMSLDDLAKSLYVGYEIEQPKFKVGNILVRNNGNIFSSGKYLVTVKEVKPNGAIYFKETDSWLHEESLRHATKEEIFWAELGRKYRQINWDDCLVLKNGEEFRVLSDRCEIYALAHLENNSVIGYYPSESFKKFQL